MLVSPGGLKKKNSTDTSHVLVACCFFPLSELTSFGSEVKCPEEKNFPYGWVVSKKQGGSRVPQNGWVK